MWPLQLKYLKIVFGNDDTGRLIPQSLTQLFHLLTLEVYQVELDQYSIMDSFNEEQLHMRK